jgi:hypothetical protein
MSPRSLFNWAVALLKSSEKDRKKAKNIALEGILKYNKGSVSKEGQEIVDFLKNDCELVGFIPHIAYIKESARNKQELEAVWVHPFAQRTLLYKVKDEPLLVIANSSIELDDSALRKIDGNHTIEELMSIAGITG